MKLVDYQHLRQIVGIFVGIDGYVRLNEYANSIA